MCQIIYDVFVHSTMSRINFFKKKLVWFHAAQNILLI